MARKYFFKKINMNNLINNLDYLSPEIIIDLYKSGIFIMAKKRNDKNIFFLSPQTRALLPIKKFHCSKSFIRFSKQKPFEVTINKSFSEVVKNCATINRTETWINKLIETQFLRLHHIGYAHSIECWQKNQLVGGIYGLAIGGCFFAESMFSKTSNGSKFALLNLVSRLDMLGYTLLDVQFVNNHLRQFGVFEVPRSTFKKQLKKSLEKKISFQSTEEPEEDPFLCVLRFLQSINTKS